MKFLLVRRNGFYTSGEKSDELFIYAGKNEVFNSAEEKVMMFS